MNDCTSFDKEKYDKYSFFKFKFHNLIKKDSLAKKKTILRCNAKRKFSFKNNLKNLDMEGKYLYI